MTELDVVVKGGMVFDGTGVPRYRADVGIRDGVIAEMGSVRASDARRVVDASGLHVAPGFVDLHTHYDAQVFWDPYCTLSGWHGVTSAVIGNCGFGFAPVRPEERERAMLTMTRVEAIPLASMQQGMPWDWVTFPEFLDSLERTPKAINLLPYVPLAPLLNWVLGLDDAKAGRRPTAAEHDELCRLLDEAMEAGGCGWSAQRLPPTGPACVQRDFDGTAMSTDVMHDETCMALTEVLARRNEGFIQITLATGDFAHDMGHIEELARLGGRPVLYNVVQAFDHLPEAHRKQIEWLERCRRKGLRVYGQGVTTGAGFTFTFEEWNLFDDAEAWCEATTGTLAERLDKLADPARREALKARLPFAATAPLDSAVVVGPRSPATERYRDRTVGEIAAEEGRHFVDVMLDIAVNDDLRTGFYLNPPNSGGGESLRELIDYPWLIPGVSDGGAHTKFFTGGRYGTEFLSELVREHEMCELEHAHWRLSALPASCAGFQGRGTLRVGAPADVLVYDYENLASQPVEVVHDLPGDEWRRVQRATGYRAILVNGVVTVEDDKETGEHPGRLLRHGA